MENAARLSTTRAKPSDAARLARICIVMIVPGLGAVGITDPSQPAKGASFGCETCLPRRVQHLAERIEPAVGIFLKDDLAAVAIELVVAALVAEPDPSGLE